MRPGPKSFRSFPATAAAAAVAGFRYGIVGASPDIASGALVSTPIAGPLDVATSDIAWPPDIAWSPDIPWSPDIAGLAGMAGIADMPAS